MARWHVKKRMMKNGKPSYRVKVELPPDPTTGTRQTKTGTFRTSKEAEAAGKAWSTEVDNGMIVTNSPATVADVYSQ